MATDGSAAAGAVTQLVGRLGHIEPFDESTSDWPSYEERLTSFLLVNRIPEDDKAIGAVVYSIALFDIDQDGDLDCVTALRTEFDKSVPSATYVWILPGLSGKEKKNVTIHVRAGTLPDKPVLTVGDDGPEQTAKFFYTDYKTCATFEAPFQGLEECMVWVAKDVIADPPQDCVDQYEDNCDVKHIAYDENTCSPFIA
ncbi:uncharacterized protein LOC144125560 isoform X1 [Amblyomma americanum]